MALEDKDLRSIQEVRDLLKKAKAAQAILATFSQEKIDELVRAISEKTYAKRVELAKMANEETGFGRWEDKVIKNLFASKVVYDSIKDMKTVGILREDMEEKLIEVAVPVGVVAGIIPSTNPTSTAIYKAMIAIKSGNSIVFSPHPGALKSILATVEIIREALAELNVPVDAVGVISIPTMQATQELMKHPLTNLILATGGNAMVKSAYSSGTPAIGVGPGNGPAYITSTADIPKAVKCIMDSKTFDNGTICASEQSVIVEKSTDAQIKAEFAKNGGYFLTKEQAEKLSKFILRPNGTMNPQIVGRDVHTIARLAEITIPTDARVLLAPEENVGLQYPYSREKLCPILAYYVVENHEEACNLAIEILMGEGAGHTMAMHTESRELIKEFALKKPVNRLLINTPAALGGIGASTALAPALTLGNGAIGGSASSDNITPLHLLNIRRVAFGQMGLEEIRAMDTQCEVNATSCSQEQLIESIVAQVFEQLKNK
ncbi:acetaldehyde dehydrogenase (acetylating) [Pilibacter termitis]|uniref:Acetaldehyde dehydrogenase (Acetylating) n=1 Tax=Pilibacter termitis TaxID=263852 RepID=A0A1T4K631_9ENTE|nr:acetaldehyde dehydrogenase (acetylating) [Pilibacter termitis]SJZ37900.1 acetaldehyde dehydrogenase (acetylating) [Pilibacter termitis]